MAIDHLHEPTASTPSGATEREILFLDDTRKALRIAVSRPDARIHVFARNWSQVDHDRAEVASRGLARRVSVHHSSALALLHALFPCLDRRAAGVAGSI